MNTIKYSIIGLSDKLGRPEIPSEPKKIFAFPIPLYDKNKMLHNDIVEMGKVLEHEIKKIIEEIVQNAERRLKNAHSSIK